MAKPVLPPFPSCAFVNPPPLPTLHTSAQPSLMSPSLNGEEKWLLGFKVAAAILIILILFVSLSVKLRQCNSSSGGLVNGVNGRTSSETSIQLPALNTDDGSFSVSVCVIITNTGNTPCNGINGQIRSINCLMCLTGVRGKVGLCIN